MSGWPSRRACGSRTSPKYFAEMKRINKEGPRVLHGFRRPERLPLTRLDEILASGATVVDTRAAASFAEGHVPGTINIALNNSFNTWAGWLLPFHRDCYLIIDDRCAHCVDEAVRDLAMIGLDRVAGYFGSEVVEEWGAGGRALATVPQISAGELAERVKAGDEARCRGVRGMVIASPSWRGRPASGGDRRSPMQPPPTH